METNRVNVKIYGQEYVIAGDKPREKKSYRWLHMLT